MTTETVLLKQIADNVIEIKARLTNLESAFNEIDSDLHELKPIYQEKLKKIEKKGNISQEEFEKQLGIRI